MNILTLPKEQIQRDRRQRLARRLRAHRRHVVIYAAIAGALFATMIHRELPPDPWGPAIVQHEQYGQLLRRARFDPNEDCLTIWYETTDGQVKFRNQHCPSPLKTP